MQPLALQQRIEGVVKSREQGESWPDGRTRPQMSEVASFVSAAAAASWVVNCAKPQESLLSAPS